MSAEIWIILNGGIQNAANLVLNSNSLFDSSWISFFFEE